MNLTSDRLIHGILAGLAGGVVFGLMMTMTGMIGMVGALAGRPGDVAVGWVLHLVISAFIGATFGVIAPSSTDMGKLLLSGGAYGIVWWVLGPLLMMPIMMGMGPQLSAAGIQNAIPSLIGHIMFGLVAGATFAWLNARSLASEPVNA
jgi:hypothetical protein